MSFTDPSAEPVQPEGQGEAGTSDAPYAEYLNRIPEDARGEVEPVFKDWDANVTRKFQEASEYRKSWEPYEQVGVNQHDPNTVQWALQVAQVAQNDPQAFWEWAQGYARENGLSVEQAAELAQAQPDEFGMYDENPQLKQLLEEQRALKGQLEDVLGWREQQEQARHQAEAQAYVESQLEALKDEPGFDRKGVERFVSNYLDQPEQAVQLAFKEYQEFRSWIEKQFVQAKADAPPAAEAGGQTPATGDEDFSLKASHARARAQLAEMSRQNQ